MENPAKDLIPSEFFAKHGGRTVAGGRVECVTEAGLVKLNQGLRMDGGWFTNEQVFFAESVPDDDVPDYFYVDANDAQPRPVRYFHLTPTDVGVCAASLDEFVQGIWNITSDRDRRYFLHTTSDGLQALVCRAFANVAKPAGAISTSYGPEAEATVDFFRGRTWQRLEADELAGSEGLAFLTPEAWHYFLPAFLLATIGEPSSDLALNTMIHLGLPDNQEQRFEKLTKEQLSVLQELFEWMNAQPPG